MKVNNVEQTVKIKFGTKSECLLCKIGQVFGRFRSIYWGSYLTNPLKIEV